MPVIEFTKDDLLQGIVVEPAWYRVHINDIGEKSSKDQGSTNYPVEANIVCNADTGDTKYAGVPLAFWMFNSKFKSALVSFLKAFGDEPAQNKRYELSEAAGRDIEMFIGNKEYNNKIVNDYPHMYRPVRTD